MDSAVRVHVATHFPEECLERIRGVSPRVRLSYRPYAVQEAPTDLESLLGDVEVLVTYHAGFDLAVAPRLRWVQLSGDGFDYLRGKPILQSEVIITNARLFAAPIAEYVFGSIIMWNRLFPKIQERFRIGRAWPSNHWEEYVGVELAGKTLAIIGHGSIGRRVARVAQAFDMQVIATRRSVDRPTREDGVEVYPADRLAEVMARGDFVVVCLPLTDETEGIIGERELRGMKPTAYLVAVGRGKVIDDDALLRCLRERWIAGAGLDVYARRPLPPDSPYFDLPNVIMTPHMSGISEGYWQRITDLFCENLRRYLAGEPLISVVDKEKGY